MRTAETEMKAAMMSSVVEHTPPALLAEHGDSGLMALLSPPCVPEHG